MNKFFRTQEEQPEAYTCPECSANIEFTVWGAIAGKQCWHRTKCECERKEQEEAERVQAEQRRKEHLKAEIRCACIPRRLRNTTFNTIKRDKNNAQVYDCCKEYAVRPPKDGKPCLYIFGPVGTGKTSLAVCTIRQIIDDAISAKLQVVSIRYANVPEWLDLIRKGFDDNEAEHEAQQLMRCKLPVIDDIGVEKPTEWAAERIYLLVNRLYEEELPAIFTSNCELDELARRFNGGQATGPGDRIASRLAEMCKQLPLKGDDRRLAR